MVKGKVLTAGHQGEVDAEDIDGECAEDEDDRDPELPVGVRGAPVGFGWVLVMW